MVRKKSLPSIIAGIVAVPLLARRLFKKRNAKQSEESSAGIVNHTSDSASPQRQISRDKHKSQIKEQRTASNPPSTRQQRRRAAIAARRRKQSPEARRKRKRKKFLKILLSSLLAAIGAVASGISIYSYYTSRISVISDAALNPSDPFSMRFSVVNEGYLTVYDLKIFCHVINVQNDVGAEVSESGAYDPSMDVRELNPADRTTVWCHMPVGFSSPPIHGEIVIYVGYRPSFYPWRQYRAIRFIGERGSDGVFRWFPQAMSK